MQKDFIVPEPHLSLSGSDVQQKGLHAFDVWRAFTLKCLAKGVAGRNDSGSF